MNEENIVLDNEQEEMTPEVEETEFKKKPEEEEEEEKKNPPSEGSDDSEDKEDSDDSKNEEEDDEDEKKKKKKMNHSASEDEDEEKCPDCGKPKSECTCEDEEEDKKKYSLEEIPEYLELQNNFSNLQSQYNALVAEIEPLREFKAAADRKEKQTMIDSFYMLSAEDKKDVIENIDTYSLDDIEAKLSIICVRNKVNFSLDEDKEEKEEPMVYSLNNEDNGGDNAPAWIKAVRSTAKTMI